VNKKKGTNLTNKNPLASSLANGGLSNKSNPATSQLEGKKMFDIHGTGKSGYGQGQNPSSHIGSNISTGSGGQSGVNSSGKGNLNVASHN
jgi:hypothetical protein